MPHLVFCFILPPKSPSASHPWLLVFHLCNFALVFPCLRILPQTCCLQISYCCKNIPSLVVRPCALIGSPRVTNANYRIWLGVSCPFTNHHTQRTHCTPSWTWCTQMSLCAHQLSCLLDQRAPFLVCFLVSIDETMCVCRWVHPTSSMHPCF